MREDKIWRLIKDQPGGEFLWLKTRNTLHWAWKYASALGPDHISVWPKLMTELCGFRGWPSRRILSFYKLRAEVSENWKLYENMSVEEIVQALERVTGLRVSKKYVYDVFKKFGINPKKRKL